MSLIGNILISSGIIQSILLSFIFLKSYKVGRDGRLLSLFFIFISLLMFINFLVFNDTLIDNPHFIKLGYFFAALLAPLFSIAVQTYFGIPKEKTWIILCNFLPAVFVLLYNLPFYLSPGSEKILYLTEVSTTANSIFFERKIQFLCSMLFNLIIFTRIFYRFKLMLNEFSDSNFHEQKIFYFYLKVILVWLFVSFAFTFFIDQVLAENISSIGFSIWIIGFAWHRVYKDQKEKSTSQTSIKTSKYKKTYLSEEKINEIGLRIKLIMEDSENLFDSELTLPLLAQKLGISINICSQVINRFYNMNFLELLRKSRIQHAKVLIRETDLPLLRIGFDVGFNSKNSFIRAFKEETGLTPSDFRSQLQN